MPSDRAVAVCAGVSFCLGFFLGWKSNSWYRKYLKWKRDRLHSKLLKCLSSRQNRIPCMMKAYTTRDMMSTVAIIADEYVSIPAPTPLSAAMLPFPYVRLYSWDQLSFSAVSVAFTKLSMMTLRFGCQSACHALCRTCTGMSPAVPAEQLGKAARKCRSPDVVPLTTTSQILSDERKEWKMRPKEDHTNNVFVT
uniref:Uncharacterized protein n=1 Tax=Branchiostoma floridae TaxID=7739 RepID=C3Y3S7_BRAFL|eukprot:XP_002608943.1 hypothetical protein BRAFLDRAFT_85482 [Branchiostoma floridae]